MIKEIKNICCLGAGYVGGPTMSVIADKCPAIDVNVVDINPNRIEKWNNPNLSDLPIFEPGLYEILKKCLNRNLFFSSDIKEKIANADMVFISVNSPTKLKGIGAGMACDIKWIELSARQIAKYSRGNTIVVEKSTVPVGTAEIIKKILKESQEEDYKNNIDQKTFSILSNPEFLSEGSAINDLCNPDRILIGGDNEESIKALENIYLNWIEEKKILRTNLWSSELSKLTANAFLAQRISSINSIGAICELSGANINEVSKAIGMDSRLGSKFLQSGPGFGGSCFPKDILNLIYIAKFYGLNEVASYWSTVIELNNWHKKRISQIIIQKLFGTISGKKIAILGFAFKANTNDTRESPAINICKDLIEEGSKLFIYDPQVSALQIEKDLDFKQIKNKSSEQSGWIFANSIEEASTNSDAIVVLTEWEEFKNLNWENLFKIMRKPSWIFDTRNISNTTRAKELGFNIWKVGNNNII